MPFKTFIVCFLLVIGQSAFSQVNSLELKPGKRKKIHSLYDVQARGT